MRNSVIRSFTLLSLATLVAVGACDGTSFSVNDDSGSDTPPTKDSSPVGDDSANDSSVDDAAPESGPTKPMCKRTAPFGPPVRVLGLPDDATQLRLLPDELTGYYIVGGTNALYRVTRASRTTPFGSPETLKFKFAGDGADAAAHGYVSAAVTGNDSTMYLAADFSIYRLFRDGGAFGAASVLPQATAGNSILYLAPEITPNGSTLLYTRANFNDAAIDNVSASVASNGTLGTATIAPLGIAGRNAYMIVSVESSMAYFASWRHVDSGNIDVPPEIWSADVTFPESGGAPQFSGFAPVAELNNPPADRFPTALSADGCRFYFTGPNANTGAASTYVAERPLQ